MDFDVVIIGGGAVGATLALELEQLGYGVAIIELRQPVFTSGNPERVIALNYGSQAHLQRLGLWQGIAAQGTGDIRHIVVTEAGNRGRIDMSETDTPKVDALGYVVEMGPMLAPIYERLQESSVSLFSPASLSAFQLLENGLHIELIHNGDLCTIKAALLVGADGTNSQVRRLAGINTLGWDYNRFGIVTSLQCEKEHGDTAYECFRQTGPLAFLPLSDGRFSIVWATTPVESAKLLAMNDDAFIAALQAAATDAVLQNTGAMTSISKRASFALELTIASSFTKPRIALVGNAAHTVHPVAGQGMNLGLRDVLSLVDMLDSELARNDPGAPIILQGYAEQRRADVSAVAGFTESMVAGFACDAPGARWLRGIALATMARLPGLKDQLLAQASGVAQMGRQS